MSASHSSDEQLELALAEFLAAEEGGRPIPHQELLARFPDIAAELKEFCEAHERLRSVAAPLRQSVEFFALGDSGLTAGRTTVRRL